MRKFVIWLVFTYSAVVVAMIVDFITGVRKARKAGIARTSRGYKMTCTKAYQYFFPMLCLTCVDVIGSAVLPCPAFTMIMASFNVFCEWKSVLESTADKERMRKMGLTFQAISSNKTDLAKLLKEILEIWRSSDDENDK